MRRLRSTDGTDLHKRAAKAHMGKLTLGGAPIHQELHDKMKVLFDRLKACARAHDDAQDVEVEASAICDFTEINLENAIRDIDADLGKLDRAEPERNARATVFPEGYGQDIDPDGEAQLEPLPKLRSKLESVGPHPIVTEAVARFDSVVNVFKTKLDAAKAAESHTDALFQEELEARRAIREQLEVAYGALRGFYKTNPRRAEDFFLREGSRRKPE